MTKTFYKWKPTILDENRFGSKFDNVNWDHSEISRLILSKSMQLIIYYSFRNHQKIYGFPVI